MEYVMQVSFEDMHILYQADVEFYDDSDWDEEGNGEISFDTEEEYDKAKRILRKE